MNQHKTLLLIVLLLQLLLAAWLFFGDRLSAGNTPALLDFDVAAVSSIAITDAKNNELRLERQENGWRVGDYPADGNKIDAMLAKLSAVDARWPIATTSAAQARFEVADDKYQRRLQLFEGDQLNVDLLFGTSPGFRRVHARAVGKESVFSVDFANHELPVGADNWLDRGLLAAGSDVNSVQRLDHFSIARGADPFSPWMLNGSAADPAEAAGLVGRFADLQVLGSVVFEGQLTGRFVVGTDAGQEYRYALYHNAQMDKYYATREDQPGRFELANYIAEQLLLDEQSLLPKAGADSGESGAPGLADQLIDQALQSLPKPAQP